MARKEKEMGLGGGEMRTALPSKGLRMIKPPSLYVTIEGFLISKSSSSLLPLGCGACSYRSTPAETGRVFGQAVKREHARYVQPPRA